MTAGRRCVLTIAGSDPSGGAGIQADLRTFGALGLVGLSAVTALTVQNSHGVRSVHPTPGPILTGQIEAILEDVPVHAVKIGMLAGAEQVHAVANALRRLHPPNVVLDPVFASTGGVSLLDTKGRTALFEDLLPLCDLITPNLPELDSMPGGPQSALPHRFHAARWLLERGARAVLIKGGHLDGQPIDTLILYEDLAATEAGKFGVEFAADRVETSHTHGTGCLLSSAIAAFLAHGFPLPYAIAEAKRLLSLALRFPSVVGSGRGFPDVTAAIRSGVYVTPTRFPGERQTNTRAAELLRGQLYVITDSTLPPGRSAEEITAQALAGGAKVIQLREKRFETAALISLARRLVAMTRAADALLIVNDRVDVALASDADGVHLGPDDMHPADARRLLGPKKLIGVSAGTVDEALELAPYASYLGVGAVFGSKTKLDAGAPIGLERIRAIRRALGGDTVPIVAIGGINLENIAEVAEAGANSAAVVSAVCAALDIRSATEALLDAFRAGVKFGNSL